MTRIYTRSNTPAYWPCGKHDVVTRCHLVPVLHEAYASCLTLVSPFMTRPLFVVCITETDMKRKEKRRRRTKTFQNTDLETNHGKDRDHPPKGARSLRPKTFESPSFSKNRSSTLIC